VGTVVKHIGVPKSIFQSPTMTPDPIGRVEGRGECISLRAR